MYSMTEPLPHSTNVFWSTGLDVLQRGLQIDKWYYADITWTVYNGPYDTYEEANSNFQAYMANVRMCPGCEE
jgi:hypothetical protein